MWTQLIATNLDLRRRSLSASVQIQASKRTPSMFTSSEDVHVCYYRRCLNTPTHADALHRTRTVMFREVSHRWSFDEPNLRTVDRVALCSARRLPRTMIPSIKRTNKSDFSRSPFRVYLLVSNCKEESRALLGPVQVFSFLEQRDDEFVSLSFRNGPSIAQRTDEMSFAAHSIHRHLTVLRKEEATKDRQTHTKRETEREAPKRYLRSSSSSLHHSI